MKEALGSRVAAILLEIDANELNNVFASQDFIIFKIGKIGNYANYRYILQMMLSRPNSQAFASPNDARSAKFRFYTVAAAVR